MDVFIRAKDVVLGIHNEAHSWNDQVDEKIHEDTMRRVGMVMPSLKVNYIYIINYSEQLTGFTSLRIIIDDLQLNTK